MEILNNVGYILAGGSGSRLSPTTKVINKHLLNVYDKPMIFYCLSNLILLGLKKIFILCNASDLNSFKNILGDGSHLGIKINFIIQKSPKGIVDGLLYLKKKIKNRKSKIIMFLGDNFFYGNEFTSILTNAINSNYLASIFSYNVSNHESYGIIEYKKNNKIKKIHEKPKLKYSGRAVTGLYVFKSEILDLASSVKPSKRGELEITDLLNLVKNNINEVGLKRGVTWFDMGTFDDFLTASSFVKVIEDRQNLKIGCPEESAYLKNFISRKKLIKISQKYQNNQYSDYLKLVANEE